MKLFKNIHHRIRYLLIMVFISPLAIANNVDEKSVVKFSLSLANKFGGSQAQVGLMAIQTFFPIYPDNRLSEINSKLDQLIGITSELRGQIKSDIDDAVRDAEERSLAAILSHVSTEMEIDYDSLLDAGIEVSELDKFVENLQKRHLQLAIERFTTNVEGDDERLAASFAYYVLLTSLDVNLYKERYRIHREKNQKCNHQCVDAIQRMEAYEKIITEKTTRYREFLGKIRSQIKSYRKGLVGEEIFSKPRYVSKRYCRLSFPLVGCVWWDTGSFRDGENYYFLDRGEHKGDWARTREEALENRDWYINTYLEIQLENQFRTEIDPMINAFSSTITEFQNMGPIAVTRTWAGRHVTYTNLSLNGKPNAISVYPGESIQVTGSWEVNTDNDVYCPNCWVQFYLGNTGNFSSCITPDQIKFENNITKNGSFDFTITAPSTPGTYPITQQESLQYSCIDMINGHTDLNNTVAVIKVLGD